jgi:ubiquinone biosynthesis protein Coq4
MMNDIDILGGTKMPQNTFLYLYLIHMTQQLHFQRNTEHATSSDDSES